MTFCIGIELAKDDLLRVLGFGSQPKRLFFGEKTLRRLLVMCLTLRIGVASDALVAIFFRSQRLASETSFLQRRDSTRILEQIARTIQLSSQCSAVAFNLPFLTAITGSPFDLRDISCLAFGVVGLCVARYQCGQSPFDFLTIFKVAI